MTFCRAFEDTDSERDGQPDEHLLPKGGGAGALGAGRHPGRGAQRGEHHLFMTIIMVVSMITIVIIIITHCGEQLQHDHPCHGLHLYPHHVCPRWSANWLASPHSSSPPSFWVAPSVVIWVKKTKEANAEKVKKGGSPFFQVPCFLLVPDFRETTTTTLN